MGTGVRGEEGDPCSCEGEGVVGTPLLRQHTQGSSVTPESPFRQKYVLEGSRWNPHCRPAPTCLVAGVEPFPDLVPTSRDSKPSWTSDDSSPTWTPTPSPRPPQFLP